MSGPLTFDAADFTLDVRLKLLDGTTRDVAIDVFSFNDEFVRMGMDAAINELPPTEFFAKHQGIVCGFLKIEPDQLPPGMAYKVMRACVDRMQEIKKKESGGAKPDSPPGTE